MSATYLTYEIIEHNYKSLTIKNRVSRFKQRLNKYQQEVWNNKTLSTNTSKKLSIQLEDLCRISFDKPYTIELLPLCYPEKDKILAIISQLVKEYYSQMNIFILEFPFHSENAIIQEYLDYLKLAISLYYIITETVYTSPFESSRKYGGHYLNSILHKLLDPSYIIMDSYTHMYNNKNRDEIYKKLAEKYPKIFNGLLSQKKNSYTLPLDVLDFIIKNSGYTQSLDGVITNIIDYTELFIESRFYDIGPKAV
jgi:hypothetical protein